MDFQTLLKQDYILLDGAMGTMLQQAGLQAGERTELAALEHPDWLEEIHRAYVRAGSHIVYANTFGANREKLAAAGHTVEEVVSASIRCARRACEGTETLVGLDVGPLPRLIRPAGDLTFDEAFELYAEMMEAGEKAGADLIVLETMADLQELRAALLAARKHSSLPVICTMTFNAGGRTFMGAAAAPFALTATALGAAALGVNCSLGPRQLTGLIGELRKWTHLPLIAKPNAGLPDKDGGYDITAEEFAASQRSLAELGVKFLGGCCGTSPAYIALLKAELEGAGATESAPKAPDMLCTESALYEIPAEVAYLDVDEDTDEDDLLDDAADLSDEDTLLCLRAGSPAAMARAVAALRGGADGPLAVTGGADTVEAGLRQYCGRCAVLGAPDDRQLAVAAARYGAVIVEEEA